MVTQEIQQQLFALQDLDYKAFHSKLMPGIATDTIIGIRIPQLRKLAKEYAKRPDIDVFLNTLPHTYYEEKNLHGFIICEIKDYGQCVKAIDQLLPEVDNWATCDLLSPKVFKKEENKPQLLKDIQRWMHSDAPYTIRFGMEMLMTHFLDDDFKPEYLNWVANIHHEHYYVKMMVAWYFATALAKQWESALPYIENKVMGKWEHNKSIQKAIESFRVSDVHKEILRKLRK